MRLRDSADGHQRYADVWLLSNEEIYAKPQPQWYEELMPHCTGVVRIIEYEIEVIDEETVY